MTHERYNLPDQGENLVRLAAAAGGPSAAAATANEVARIRRADGAIASTDIRAYSKDKDGPLSVLRLLLNLEEIHLKAWAELGFGMFQKRPAVRRAEEIYRESGIAAAVAWVQANATKKIHLSTLADGLSGSAFYLTINEASVVDQMRRALKKWKK